MSRMCGCCCREFPSWPYRREERIYLCPECRGDDHDGMFGPEDEDGLDFEAYLELARANDRR